MIIRLDSEAIGRLRATLSRAGKRESGGQLFGEQLASSDFRITELTVQSRPGTFAQFFVDTIQATRDAVRFFKRTNHQYRRYNYIGEWHSHPSSSVQPSETDAETMRDLVQDSAFKGTFAVLMIVRLDDKAVTASAWVFDPMGAQSPITLEMAY